MAYGNYSTIINKKFTSDVTTFEGNYNSQRIGTLATKLGMTTMWDKWGRIVPVTILELDRVQITQIKEPEANNSLYQVQIGAGEKSMKRLTKSQLGHYVKARVPPKQILTEFRVTKECLLPIGYMLNARHYAPGMYVDVLGKTVGHGFQGTIKRWGFRRQPASHGNSVTTRVLGSTGGRQDPGRVFKQKKMYGRMGGKVSVQYGLQVFKIDAMKNLVYVKGSVPGKAGTIVKLRDTVLFNRKEDNLELAEYPTFIEKEGVKYAREISMYCGERDPSQI